MLTTGSERSERVPSRCVSRWEVLAAGSERSERIRALPIYPGNPILVLATGPEVKRRDSGRSRYILEIRD